MDDEASITWSERAVVAIVSLFAAAVTVWVLAALIMAIADEMIVMSFTFITAGAIFMAVATVAGFVFPDRASRWWGILWGTEPRTRWQKAWIWAMVIAVCLLAIYEHLSD